MILTNTGGTTSYNLFLQAVSSGWDLPVLKDVYISQRIVVPYTGNEPECGILFGKIESHLLEGVPSSYDYLVNQTVRAQLRASVCVNTAALTDKTYSGRSLTGQ